MEQNGEPRNKPTHGHLIFDKEKKGSLFSKWCLETRTATCKSMKLEYSRTPIHKSKLKMAQRIKYKT